MRESVPMEKVVPQEVTKPSGEVHGGSLTPIPDANARMQRPVRKSKPALPSSSAVRPAQYQQPAQEQVEVDVEEQETSKATQTKPANGQAKLVIRPAAPSSRLVTRGTK